MTPILCIWDLDKPGAELVLHRDLRGLLPIARIAELVRRGPGRFLVMAIFRNEPVALERARDLDDLVATVGEVHARAAVGDAEEISIRHFVLEDALAELTEICA